MSLHPQEVSVETKVTLVQDYLDGKIGASEAALRCAVSTTTFKDWVMRFRSEGVDAFLPYVWNRVYSYELKLQAVLDYLVGKMSASDVCVKYHIRSRSTLRDWVKVYNGHGDLNSVKFSGGGSYMTKGRETTQEERVRIAADCVASGKNYGAIAVKYHVSYTQARTWTKKYIEMGPEGLEDRRGQKKKDQAPRTELEKAQVKIKQLEHDLEMAQMENNLLKKVQEVERRNACQK